MDGNVINRGEREMEHCMTYVAYLRAILFGNIGVLGGLSGDQNDNMHN